MKRAKMGQNHPREPIYMRKSKKRFWFHYNKPYSQKYKVNKWSVHYDGVCHIVDSINCYVYTFSRERKKQPRVVMYGDCTSFEVDNGKAIIK